MGDNDNKRDLPFCFSSPISTKPGLHHIQFQTSGTAVVKRRWSWVRQLLPEKVVLVCSGWWLCGFVGHICCYFHVNKHHDREEGCTDAAFGLCDCNGMIISFFVMGLLVAGFAVQVGECWSRSNKGNTFRGSSVTGFGLEFASMEDPRRLRTKSTSVLILANIRWFLFTSLWAFNLSEDVRLLLVLNDEGALSGFLISLPLNWSAFCFSGLLIFFTCPICTLLELEYWCAWQWGSLWIR